MATYIYSDHIGGYYIEPAGESKVHVSDWSSVIYWLASQIKPEHEPWRIKDGEYINKGGESNESV